MGCVVGQQPGQLLLGNADGAEGALEGLPLL